MRFRRLVSVAGLLLALSACGKDKKVASPTGSPQKPANYKPPITSAYFLGEDETANPVAAEVSRVFRIQLKKKTDLIAYTDVNSVLEGANPPGELALKEGKSQYTRGKELLDQLKPEDAFPFLNDAWGSYIGAFSYLTDEDKTELRELCLDMAKASFLAKKKQAVTPEMALHRALLLDSSLTFDPKRLSPRMEKVFNDTKAAMQTGARGTLHVESSPSYSEVYINGAFAGVTPLDVPDLLVGENIVSVRKDGYEKYTHVVTVSEKGKSQEVALLAPLSQGKLLEDIVNQARTTTGTLKASEDLMDFNKIYQLDVVILGVAETDPDTNKVRLTAYVYDLRKQERINRREIIVDPKAPDRERLYTQFVDQIFLNPVKDDKGKQVELPIDLSGVRVEGVTDVCKQMKLADPNADCKVAKPPIWKRKSFYIIAAAVTGVVVIPFLTGVGVFVFEPDFKCDPDKDGSCVGIDLDGDGSVQP